MAGFGMDKSVSSSRGGFGMSKSTHRESGRFDPEIEDLPEYLQIESEDSGFVFYYSEGEEIERVLEVDTEKPEVMLEGEDFSDADYELFIQDAEKVLYELEELENPYTLLEHVSNYA
jgi:hypothetical protein